MKPIGKNITKIFKVIFRYKKRYCRKEGLFSGLKNFWCIDKNAEVTDMLDGVNLKKKARTISTFDFTTLYTKIPHTKLIDVLSKLVDSIFSGTVRTRMAVGNKMAYWVKGTSKNQTYNSNQVKSSLEFLIKNAYFHVGDTIFRQIVGIPMGSDPAPFFANLFLFYYECLWMKNLRKNNIGRGKKFANIFRFIDDLIVVNDNGEFERSWKEIYPSELVLEKENQSDQSATFLDLDIHINNGEFDYKLYDKRNGFKVRYKNFKIVRFPFRSSNMPNKMFYSTISAEILRICRATKQFQNFKVAVTQFLERMKVQGGIKEGIKGSISKLLKRHKATFTKYNIPTNAILSFVVEHF